MRRSLRWLVPVVLTVGVVAGAGTAWRIEADVPGTPPVSPADGAVTPVLSVRRVPALVAAPIAARRLYADLDALVPYLPSDSCLVVEGPDLRFAHRADTPVVPASTTKLLTATASLLALDAETRLRTAVVATAAPAGGVVAGDLTLVGGGDPLLATSDYVTRFRRQPQVLTDVDQLAAAVRAAGVTRIEGSVVGDETRHDAVRYVAGWPPRYIDQNVVGPLSALAVNDGFATYPTATTGGLPLEPAPDPAQNGAAVLTRLLEARGVEVLGAPRAGSAPSDAVEVAAIESVPLVDVVGQMLSESDNNTAELLLREIGLDAGEPTTASGAAATRELLDDGTVDLRGVTVVDGSGLSLDNRATCDALVDVLGRTDTGALLRERLPVAAESGTLADRYGGTPLAGVLRAKTGSLTSVSSLAGLVEDGDPALTFAVVANVPPPARVPDGVDAVHQQIGEVLVAWPRTPDVARLGPVVEGG